MQVCLDDTRVVIGHRFMPTIHHTFTPCLTFDIFSGGERATRITTPIEEIKYSGGASIYENDGICVSVASSSDGCSVRLYSQDSLATVLVDNIDELVSKAERATGLIKDESDIIEPAMQRRTNLSVTSPAPAAMFMRDGKLVYKSDTMEIEMPPEDAIVVAAEVDPAVGKTFISRRAPQGYRITIKPDAVWFDGKTRWASGEICINGTCKHTAKELFDDGWELALA